jgi:hypothetical protein
MDIPGALKAPELEIPSFSGTKSQKLGSKMQLTMTCDLDIEPGVKADTESERYIDSNREMIACTWKRPQTSNTKTDENNIDIFLELLHLGGSDIDYPWTWLKLGDPDMQFKAELIEVRPSLTGEEGMIDLVWREYRHGNASDETYKERFGIGL